MEFEHFFIIAVVFIIASGLFRFFKNGGMLGAKVKQTIGEVEAGKTFGSKQKLKVHQLVEGNPEKAVGLVVQSTSVGHFQILPITLSVSEAKHLQELIGKALNEQ